MIDKIVMCPGCYEIESIHKVSDLYDQGTTITEYDELIGGEFEGKLIGGYERRRKVTQTDLARKLAPPLNADFTVMRKSNLLYYCSNCKGVFMAFRSRIVSVDQTNLLLAEQLSGSMYEW